jgi:hypothetical protein
MNDLKQWIEAMKQRDIGIDYAYNKVLRYLEDYMKDKTVVETADLLPILNWVISQLGTWEEHARLPDETHINILELVKKIKNRYLK